MHLILLASLVLGEANAVTTPRYEKLRNIEIEPATVSERVIASAIKASELTTSLFKNAGENLAGKFGPSKASRRTQTDELNHGLGQVFGLAHNEFSPTKKHPTEHAPTRHQPYFGEPQVSREDSQEDHIVNKGRGNEIHGHTSQHESHSDSQQDSHERSPHRESHEDSKEDSHEHISHHESLEDSNEHSIKVSLPPIFHEGNRYPQDTTTHVSQGSHEGSRKDIYERYPLHGSHEYSHEHSTQGSLPHIFHEENRYSQHTTPHLPKQGYAQTPRSQEKYPPTTSTEHPKSSTEPQHGELQQYYDHSDVDHSAKNESILHEESRNPQLTTLHLPRQGYTQTPRSQEIYSPSTSTEHPRFPTEPQPSAVPQHDDHSDVDQSARNDSILHEEVRYPQHTTTHLPQQGYAQTPRSQEKFPSTTSTEHIKYPTEPQPSDFPQHDDHSDVAHSARNDSILHEEVRYPQHTTSHLLQQGYAQTPRSQEKFPPTPSSEKTTSPTEPQNGNIPMYDDLTAAGASSKNDTRVEGGEDEDPQGRNDPRLGTEASKAEDHNLLI